MKSNDELQKDVMSELQRDPLLKDECSQIGVSAKDGVITLSGIVSSYRKKMAVEHAAQRVRGVKVVASDIEIAIGNRGKNSDTEIAELVNNALRWNTAVNEDKIEVKVDNGWIYLDGEVDWEYQKISAQNSVSELPGVKGVTNEIAIMSKEISATDIKNKIASAFQRSAAIDAQGINIETKGSRVTLRGTVRTWTQKEEAERIAWSSPGVLTVDNHLEIDTEVPA